MTLIPTTGDGRNLDLRIAEERGEGATIEIRTPDEAWPVPSDAETTASTIDTYYDLPVVKAAPWRWYVPAYFYAGGLAGAAATLAPFSSHQLAHRLHWIAALGDAAGAAFLIADLGRPARFHHMLRVFRPSSPMNVGTWILGAAGTSSALALVGYKPASIASAIAGSMLSTYTGVLVGNTAVPLWNATRRALPVWFAASSAASLASILELVTPRRPRSYVIGAKLAELVGRAVVGDAAREADVAAPLHEGRAATLWKAARWLSVASLAGTLLGRPRLAGLLGTTAGLLSRFAFVEAGHSSAADPRATFEPQRRRLAT